MTSATLRKYHHRAIAARARRAQLSQAGGSKQPQAMASLDRFWAYMFPDKPAPRHFKRWFKLIQTGQTSEALAMAAGPNIEILGPRDSAKSTFAVAACAWVIGWNPGIRLLYVSYSESVALEMSRRIKRLIASQRYRDVFPWIRVGKRNNEGEWEIDKAYAASYRDKPPAVRIEAGSEIDATYTLYAAGVLGSIMSKRADLIWCDDLIKSKEAIESSEIRNKMLSNLDGVISPCLVVGGRWVDVGMLARAGDVHHTFFTESNGFAVDRTEAVYTTKAGNEKSYWPERHPLAELKRKRDRAPQIFALQYMNQLQQEDDQFVIDPACIKWGDAPSIKEFKKLVLAVDLAATERESADFTSFTLIGLMADPLTYWILENTEFKASGNTAKLKKIRELRQRLKRSFKIVFEKGAYQNSFEGDLKDYRNQEAPELRSCAALGIPSTKDLRARVVGVSGAFENDYVRFSNGGPGLHPLIYQLTNLHKDELEHDDAASSCALGLQYLQGRRKGGVAWTA
jgi:phage terminase large subunit-like protein